MRYWSQQLGTHGIDPLHMYNVKGLLTALLGAEPSLVNPVANGVFLVAVAAIAWLWRRGWHPDDSATDLRLALTLLLGTLTLPYAFATDLLVLVVSAVLGYTTLRRQETALVRVGGLLLVACPWLLAIDWLGRGPWPGNVRPFFFVLVAFAVSMAYLLSRRTSRPASLAPAVASAYSGSSMA
jgi:hypothetical protein